MKYKTSFAALLLFLMLVASCLSIQESIGTSRFKQEYILDQQAEQVAKAAREEIHTLTVCDNPQLYAEDDPGSIVHMYLTIREGNPADNTDHTWEELNSHSVFYYEELGIERARVEAILQIGDENGPLEGELGYNTGISNAIVQIRGNTTSLSDHKSYKVELLKSAGEWRGQTTIALNKHPYDGLRFRNKLGYDLMRDLPQMIGMRTQFVQLHVKDETKEYPDSDFISYGLFTQVEQPNRRYLLNHGLDRNGQFYKVNAFEFYDYEDIIKEETDFEFDSIAFNTLVESKSNNDHRKLMSMLRDVNDYSVSNDDLFSVHFDKDNYFTWLAFHILIYNTDTVNRNYYLYSPQNSSKWYFVNWDLDDAFGLFDYLDTYTSMARVNEDDVLGCFQGLSNYWGVLLHRRVLEQPEYRLLLDQKIEEIRAFLSPERINALVSIYREATKELCFANGDNLLYTWEEYDYYAGLLADTIEHTYNLYKRSLEKSQPFFVNIHQNEYDILEISWEISFSFDNQYVNYELVVAQDLSFADPIFFAVGLRFPEAEIEPLPEGTYFLRVVAVNEQGLVQPALNYYVDDYFFKHCGVIGFHVLSDGTIEVVDSSSRALREGQRGW